MEEPIHQLPREESVLPSLEEVKASPALAESPKFSYHKSGTRLLITTEQNRSLSPRPLGDNIAAIAWQGKSNDDV